MSVAQDSVNLANELEKESSSFHTIKKRLKDQLYRLQVEERALRTLLACGAPGTNNNATETFFSEVGETDGSNIDPLDTENLDQNVINKRELQDLTPLKFERERNISNGETESTEELD